MVEGGQSPIVRFGLGLGASLFVISAPISGYFLYRSLLESRANKDWPSVDGRLLKVSVGETGMGRYYPDVSYSYTIDGQAYTGSRVRASDGEYNIRDGAVQAIQGLQVGQQIAVYFSPSDPQESVLRTGAGFQEYALLGVPIIMLAMGLHAFMRLRSMRPTRDQASGEPWT